MQDDLSREDAPEQPAAKESLASAEPDFSEPDSVDPELADPEFAPPECVELSPEEAAHEMALTRETLRRIERMIGIAGVVCAAAVLWPLGWAVAAGVLLGTGLSWINFRWLAASVNAIGERIVKAQSRERGTAVALRGVGRIALIALFAYGIFECSVRGFVGFLAGLAMPVIAMTCEAMYEFVVSVRRPS
jgi:hypothetical protein